MSEQTEQFKIATEENLTIIEEPTPAPDDEHSEELPQEIKDGIQNIIINDLVNKLEEKVNKKVAEQVQCETCEHLCQHNLSNILINADQLKLKRLRKSKPISRRLALARLAPLWGANI